MGSAVIAGVISFIGVVYSTRATREQRREDRLDAAYGPLIDYALRLRQWAEATEDTLAKGSPPPPTVLLAEDDVLAFERQLTLYGTSAVEELLGGLNRAFRALMRAVTALETDRRAVRHESSSPPVAASHLLEAQAAVDGRRAEVVSAVMALQRQVNRELAGRSSARRWRYRRRGQG